MKFFDERQLELKLKKRTGRGVGALVANVCTRFAGFYQARSFIVNNIIIPYFIIFVNEKQYAFIS